MKKILIFLFAALVFLGSTSFLVATNAAPSTQEEIAKQLQAAAGEKGAGYGVAQDPRLTIANIVRTALEFLGVIFIILTMYAGFLWMTAGGNEEKVTKAKTLLFQAVIGLAIILTAYSITLMVVKIISGKWTDYDNRTYIIEPPSIECGLPGQPACPF
jgi:hypothetical protein